jgi:hypothetical protein
MPSDIDDRPPTRNRCTTGDTGIRGSIIWYRVSMENGDAREGFAGTLGLGIGVQEIMCVERVQRIICDFECETGRTCSRRLDTSASMRPLMTQGKAFMGKMSMLSSDTVVKTEAGVRAWPVRLAERATAVKVAMEVRTGVAAQK